MGIVEVNRLVHCRVCGQGIAITEDTTETRRLKLDPCSLIRKHLAEHASESTIALLKAEAIVNYLLVEDRWNPQEHRQELDRLVTEFLTGALRKPRELEGSGS